MGIGCIIAGVIFLFNPFISIYDILPDVIGYGLIIYGLSRIADVELKVMEAKRRMTNALYVAAGRFAVTALSFTMEFDATLTLVFSFALATLEIFFLLPAFNMFFEGIEYSSMRFSSKSINKRAEDLTIMTPIFLVVRSAAAVIPELTALTNEYGYVGDESGLENSRVLYILLLVMGIVVSLIFGLVWLSMILPYLKSLKKNKEYLSYIKERYETEVLTDGALQMRRSVKRFGNFWFASCFFITCISIDGYYLIPEFVCVLLMFFAFYFSRKYVAEYKNTVLLCVLTGGVMLAAYALLYRFSSNMGYMIYPYQAEGFAGYFFPYSVVAVVGYVLCILLCKKGRDTMKAMIGDCVGVRGTGDIRRKEIDEYRKAELCKYADRLFVLQCVAYGGSAVLMAAMPWFDLAWTARSILAIVVIIYAYNVMSDINEEAEKAL